MCTMELKLMMATMGTPTLVVQAQCRSPALVDVVQLMIQTSFQLETPKSETVHSTD